MRAFLFVRFLPRLIIFAHAGSHAMRGVRERLVAGMLPTSAKPAGCVGHTRILTGALIIL
jgi:hypothetical protein